MKAQGKRTEDEPSSFFQALFVYAKSKTEIKVFAFLDEQTSEKEKCGF